MASRPLPEQNKVFNAVFERYLKFAESRRPDLAAIEDPVKRIDEITKWMAEMEEPEKLLIDFVENDPDSALQELTSGCITNDKDAVGKMDQVKKLPVQDTIWLIDEILDAKDEDGQTFRGLIVYDQKGYCIGSKTGYAHEKSFVELCRELLCTCCLYPMVGVPRRPLKVTFKEPQSAEKAVGLYLTDMGITYMYAGIDHTAKEESIRMRECCMCHLRGSKDLFKKCSGCQAMLYCSKDCQKTDWTRKGPMGPHSHKLWCKKMKLYMQKVDELRQLPFTFAEKTSSEDFDLNKYKSFLERHGVYGQGAWRRECDQCGSAGDCLCKVPYGELSQSDDGIVLPVESTILDDPPDKPAEGVHDWETYYKFRGLRLDSPVAILLQWPLTVYCLVKYCLPNDYGSWWDNLDDSTFKIDILGVEKEVEMLPVFKELGYLCPDLSIDIQMYGNEISKTVDGKVYECGNLKIEVIRGLYHRKSSTARKPHLAVGFNAGLGAYQQWSQTLVMLRTQKTPAYFTDYCQYSCECARAAVEGLGIGTTSEPVVNPFRNPVRKLAAENDMPWYSNGFLYHLIYP